MDYQRLRRCGNRRGGRRCRLPFTTELVKPGRVGLITGSDQCVAAMFGEHLGRLDGEVIPPVANLPLAQEALGVLLTGLAA